MSGESSGASSGSTPSLLMPTMESTSSTPSLVLSTSDPPSVTITTSSDMFTTSYEMLTDSPVSFSTTSATSGSSPPSMSGSSTDATTPATSTDASSYLSSLYPGISSFPPQTSTTIEQAQTTSTVPSPPPTIGGGALATSTQISSSGNSFFNDRGAVIGTFVVVAIVSTAMFACLCYAWRRRLQRRNRNQMFNTITWPRDDQRLQAEAGDQPTTSMPSDSTSKPNSDALLHSIRAEEMQTAGISAPATRSTTNEIGPSYEGLFRDYFAKKRKHISRGLTEMAITTNMRPDSPVPSLTPSTSSMYLPILPPMETESNVTGSTVHSTPFSLPSTSPPPRPPRRRRPPPPPSWKLTETAETPSSLTTSVSFTTLVPPSSSYTLDSISPSSIPDQSRTDSQLRSMTPALVLDRSDHPTRADVRSDRENTFFLKRSLVHGS
ncbi:hypothetical protein L210DRAFT_3528677 [Boletus edulis BED1]|uniref:Uncharacterized protein n=1 Tax=Boletus edulis BED1 TaxID=1328754 RepID=A0AAD4C1C3_BOLED|nr:hypothetical protein L210DRAFT_3528677 [Boletus edulis BED1]